MGGVTGGAYQTGIENECTYSTEKNIFLPLECMAITLRVDGSGAVFFF